MTEKKNPPSKAKLPELYNQIWWFVLIQGILLLILGWMMISRPGYTFAIFVMFLGAYWLIDGIFVIAKSIEGRKHIAGWGWNIFFGCLRIAASVVIFLDPLITAMAFNVFLVWFMGIGALVFGIGQVVNGIRLRKQITNEFSVIVGGILAIVFGVLILSINPLVQVTLLAIFIGFFAMAGGAAQIINAFKARSHAEKALQAGESE